MRAVSLQMFAAALAAATVTGCANPPSRPAGVPDALQPPANEEVAMVLPATGVQVYECRAGTGASPAWAFVAPDAELFDRQGRRVGHHDAGPRWHLADGSVVVGAVKQRTDAPQAGAIPWLLLSARPEGPAGAADSVTHIQRIHTTGGIAPSGGCSAETVGRSARVAYTADYYLYRKAL
jgi:uncharacterized protein DUF3455